MEGIKCQTKGCDGYISHGNIFDIYTILFL